MFDWANVLYAFCINKNFDGHLEPYSQSNLSKFLDIFTLLNMLKLANIADI